MLAEIEGSEISYINKEAKSNVLWELIKGIIRNKTQPKRKDRRDYVTRKYW